MEAQKNQIIEFESDVIGVLNELKVLLVSKNRKYGNSALEPVRIFSKEDEIEQIKVRIDDKLSRLKNQQHDEDEDVVDDLLGYLVLLKIAYIRKERYEDIVGTVGEVGDGLT